MRFRAPAGWCCKVVVCVALALSCSLASAQRYPFFNLGIEQGLVQSQVFTLLQDSSGRLWAGTLGGLSCYDGKSFRSYTMRDGLPSNTITTLCCNAKGDICVGTNRGVSVFDGRAFQNYAFTTTDNPRSNAVNHLSPSPDGSLWCLAGQIPYLIRKGKVTRIPLPDGVERINSLKVLNGEVWASKSVATSIYRYRGGHWDSLALPYGSPFFVLKICKDRLGKPVLLTGRGIYRFGQAGWTEILRRDVEKDPLFFAFAEAHDGSYWLGTSKGAMRISGNNRQHFEKQNGFSDLMVDDVLEDREHNIWLATNGEGLYRFSGAAFTAVDERVGLTAPQVSSIAQDQSGTVYLGTYDGGLFRYANGKAEQVSFPGIPMRVPISALELRGNTLWIGTQGIGLWRYNINTGAIGPYRDKKLGPGVLMMSQDTAGIWIATGKTILLAAHDSLRDLNLKTGAEAFVHIGRDSILLASSEGFFLYSKDTTIPFYTHSAADSGQVVCMAARNGAIWIGTSDNGLFGYQLNNGATTHISKKEGLRSDFIYNVYAAPDGSVWAGTGFGICHIRPALPRAVVTFYGRNAGLTGMESNKNAVLPLADGSIWFGTTGGALRYHPENTLAVTKPVSMQLQALTLFGEQVKDTGWFSGISPFYGVPQALRLPWRQNNLSFSFGAVSLTGDEDVTYRYRLEGLPAPWSEWSKATTVTFSALPPGKYELQVQCSSDGNHPEAQMLRYPFEIITPFHKTNLFRFLIIVACVILGVGLQYLAARRKRIRRAQLEAIRREEQAKVRQRTAEDFHDEVGNKLTRINVLTNVLRSKVGAAPDATRIIDQIQDNAGQLYSGTRDILWSLQPSNDNLYQVMNRVRDFGRDLFGDTDTDFEMELIPQSWKGYPLAMDASRNLIMIFKEALNNTLKYSGATRVSIATQMQDGEITLYLRDNGEGFDCSEAKRGQGISNMKTRAGRLAGTLDIDSRISKGTTITLKLKIPQNKGILLNGNGRH